MNKKISIGGILTILFVTGLLLLSLLADHKVNHTPATLYQVYLKGKSLGVIRSKDELDEYIDKEQESIKAKYKIDTVYVPIGVEIKKVVTHSANVMTASEIYDKLIDVEPFTIKGMVFQIVDSEDQSKKQELKVLNKKIFDDAIEKTEKAFVDPVRYEKYLENTQDVIKETGTVIESIDKKETITYRDELLATTDTIFSDADTLAKYMLFGTTEKQAEYTVEEGDTIEDVAYKNKLNAQEFLIANSEFGSANSLLYPGQKVVVGLIKPIVNIVVMEYEVAIEDKSYVTEIQYDSTLPMGSETELRAGEIGQYEVTRQNQYINGQFIDTKVLSSTELKPSVSRIIVKGNKYIPTVADPSYWAWPTGSPYTITSGYEYRWGTFHDAIDIISTGWGAPIYAANNGVVVETVNSVSKGISVTIKHNYNNYYTYYQHLSSFNVTVGQTVARGQRIASMGNTGTVYPVPTAACPACGTHLHFALWIGPPYGGGGYHVSPWILYR